jgi:hypothetical protein
MVKVRRQAMRDQGTDAGKVQMRKAVMLDTLIVNRATPQMVRLDKLTGDP